MGDPKTGLPVTLPGVTCLTGVEDFVGVHCSLLTGVASSFETAPGVSLTFVGVFVKLSIFIGVAAFAGVLFKVAPPSNLGVISSTGAKMLAFNGVATFTFVLHLIGVNCIISTSAAATIGSSTSYRKERSTTVITSPSVKVALSPLVNVVPFTVVPCQLMFSMIAYQSKVIQKV
jgi:hypothetical protein